MKFGTFHQDEAMPHKQLLKHAYQKLHIPITFIYLPSERSLILSNSGKLDGEVSRLAGIEKIYPNLAMVNVPLQTVILYAYSKNETINIIDRQGLKPYRIAYLRGVKSIEKQFSSFNLEAVSTIQQAFFMLMHNRVDIVITGDEEGAINNLPLAQMGIKKLMPPIYQFSIYHYVNKKHRQLIPELEAVLTEIVQHRKFKDDK